MAQRSRGFPRGGRTLVLAVIVLWSSLAMAQDRPAPAPPPPPRVESPAASPSPDAVWIPGYWVWQDARWQWTGGQWEKAQGRFFVPGRYRETPQGWVREPGRWQK